MVVVPHTVPSRVRDELSVLRGRSDAEARTVCVLGRLSPQKDVDYFLAVVDAVIESASTGALVEVEALLAAS